MIVTLLGDYRKGHILLKGPPPGIEEGPVIVTVAEAGSAPLSARFLQKGKYSKGRMSTEEDFRMAEWRGDDGDGA